MSRPSQPSGILPDSQIICSVSLLNSLPQDVVDGQKQLDTLGLGLVEKLQREGEALVVAEGIADLAAGGLHEGVGHAAADEQGVDLFNQVGDDADLVLDLGAAEDGHEGALGVGDGLAEEVQLLADEEAGHGGQILGQRPRWRHARDATVPKASET